MKVYNRQTSKPVELSLIVDGVELIGELIDWSKFTYSEMDEDWSADNSTIEGVKYLIERRLQHERSEVPQLRRVDKW